MKLKYAINLHKGSTVLIVSALMIYFNNYSATAFVYLALHGCYGLMWLLKDRLFPDKQWDEQVSIGYAVFGFCALLLYWIPAWLVVQQTVTAPPHIIGIAIALNIIGSVLHFGSDAQKFFTLKYKKGLITEGFFSQSRNPNYLGEFMIYIGFALLSMHWLGFIGIIGFFAAAFIPNMIKKDKSLSRYPEFAEYKKKSGLFIPKFW